MTRKHGTLWNPYQIQNKPSAFLPFNREVPGIDTKHKVLVSKDLVLELAAQRILGFGLVNIKFYVQHLLPFCFITQYIFVVSFIPWPWHRQPAASPQLWRSLCVASWPASYSGTARDASLLEGRAGETGFGRAPGTFADLVVPGCFRSCSLPGTVRDNTVHTGVRYAVILPTRCP